MHLLDKYAKITPPRVLTGGFSLIIAIGALLLHLPAASRSGLSLPFIDALFTAVSATCVTGLIVVDTGTHFTLFGQIVILVMLQLGGIGFMTTATWLAIALRKRITLQERLILKESLNQTRVEGIVRLIVRVFIYSVTIECAAALYFILDWWNDMPNGRAVYFGIFHSISLFNNAGFELFGGFRSLTPYVNDMGINIISIMLIITGSIGFIVISELVDYPQTRRLSLHSKVVLWASAVLTSLGAFVIYICEFTNKATLGQLSWHAKLMSALFQSVTLRSAGVNTIDIEALREATQFFMVIMMFIGAAPGSTGGGIKITTFVVLLGALLAMARGKDNVVLFRYRIAERDVHKAVTYTVIAVFLLVLVTMLLSVTQQQPDFLSILFEATSAFGTVGLSMGLTLDLTTIGKVLIIAMMFIGRIGLVTLAFALQPKPEKELFRYPEGKIIIG